MAHRRDEIDPLDVMIARQRLWRRALLFALMLGLVRLLMRADLPQMIAIYSLLFSAVSTHAAAAPPPVVNVGKMTAAQVEQHLRVAPLTSGAPGKQYCLPGEKGWDYVCAYSAANPAVMRMKIGVRVSATGIVEASMPYPCYAALPRATGS